MVKPLGLKREDISPITVTDAKAKGIYFEVTPSTTVKDVLDYLNPYHLVFMYAKTRSGKEVVLEISSACEGSSFEPSTGKLTHEFLNKNQILFILFSEAKTPKEIYGPKASIFLDEYNLNYYMDNAKKILAKYGKDKLPNVNITGEDYYKKMEEMVNVAHLIMDKKLVPDIFDLIPLKKDGTFQGNRRIYIYQNGLSCFEDWGDYVDGYKIALCIVPHDTFEYRDEYDMLEDIDKHRARLAISFIMGVKKNYPLLDKTLKVQDIKKKASYLKQSDLNIGAIYKEKSGTEYLFLGRIEIDYECNPVWKIPEKYTNDNPIEYYKYLKVTKKVKEIIDKSHSLDEFLELYAKNKLKSSQDSLNLSSRRYTTPRKFVEETSFPFKGKGWKNVNLFGPHATPGVLCETMFTMNIFKYSRGMIYNHFRVGFDDTE